MERLGTVANLSARAAARELKVSRSTVSAGGRSTVGGCGATLASAQIARDARTQAAPRNSTAPRSPAVGLPWTDPCRQWGARSHGA